MSKQDARIIRTKGTMWFFIETTNGYVLDLTKGNGDIKLASKHGEDTQLWKLDTEGILHNKTGMVADIFEGKRSQGTKVIGYGHIHKGLNQMFVREGLNIKSQMHELVFDGGRLVVGSVITMMPKNEKNQQHFQWKPTFNMDRFNAVVKVGINSFVETVNILASQADDSFEAVEETAQEILPIVNKMRKNFQDAEKISKKDMHDVQRETEELMQDKEQLNRELNEKNKEKQRLAIKMTADQENLKIQQQRLNVQDNQYKNLQNISNDANEKAEAEAAHRRTVTGVGAGLFAIPIVGWIAGATMVSVGETVLADNANLARSNANDAEQRVNEQKARVENARRDLQTSQNKIKENENSIKDNGQTIRSVEETLKFIKSIESEVHDIQLKIQSCMTAASSFFNSSKNTSRAVEYAVTLEQILVPMGDLMNTADRQSGALSASLQGKIKQAQQTWNMIQQCQSSALNDISDW